MARKKAVKGEATSAPTSACDDNGMCIRCDESPLYNHSPIIIAIRNGYVMRKFIDCVRFMADEGMFLMQEGMIRFQASGSSQGRYNEAMPFVDSMLIASKLDQFTLKLPEDRDSIFIPVNMGEMQKATSSTRKNGQLIITTTPDYSSLLLASGDSESPSVRLVKVMGESTPVNPPEMSVDARQPQMELDVAPFCTGVNEFVEKSITHVKIVVHDGYMDWIGYQDESTVVRTKRFGANTRNGNASLQLALLACERNAVDVPGSTFFISKNTINALSKIKSVPTSNSKILVYHAPGDPLKLCFNISDIGIAHIYFVQNK